MVKGTSLLSQFQALLPRSQFQQLVTHSGADRKVQKATCWSHFQVLLIGLLTGRSSLRDLATTLGGREKQLVPLRIGSVDRSTLSYANHHRPAEVLLPLLPLLINRYRTRTFSLPKSLTQRLVRLDSTVFRVSHTLFPWAAWAKGASGVRLHLGLEGPDLLPSFVRITPYKIGELSAAREWQYPPGTILCFDRGYFDPFWFTQIDAHPRVRGDCVFVTRWRSDVHYRVVRKLPADKGSPVAADEIIRFSGEIAGAHCRIALRRIEYTDPQTGKLLVFLTNQMAWSALTIADLYRSRWQIETFFRWLKQTLKLRRFWSVCENGVQWQVWSALILYLLLKLIQLASACGWSLLTLMRKIAAHLFDPVKWFTLLGYAHDPPTLNTEFCSIYS